MVRANQPRKSASFYSWLRCGPADRLRLNHQTPPLTTRASTLMLSIPKSQTAPTTNGSTAPANCIRPVKNHWVTCNKGASASTICCHHGAMKAGTCKSLAFCKVWSQGNCRAHCNCWFESQAGKVQKPISTTARIQMDNHRSVASNTKEMRKKCVLGAKTRYVCGRKACRNVGNVGVIVGPKPSAYPENSHNRLAPSTASG